MGVWSQAYRSMRMTPEQRDAERGMYMLDILRANNRPEYWCIDAGCNYTNWQGFCRLHLRSVNCPDFRQNGGWFR